MHNRKNAIATLIGAALLGRLGASKRSVPPPAPSRTRSFKDRKGKQVDVKRGRIRMSPSRYRPHQSDRECLRRIGGAMWEQFKRDDRVRRGLPADKREG